MGVIRRQAPDGSKALVSPPSGGLFYPEKLCYSPQRRKERKGRKENQRLAEVLEHFVIHLLGELTELHKLLFPLRSLYLCAFAVRISG